MLVPATTSPPPAPVAPTLDVRERNIVRFFVVQVATLVFLQKVAVPVPGGGVELALLIIWAGMAWLMRSPGLIFDIRRLVVFAIFATAAVVGQLGAGQAFSPAAIFLPLALYFPLCLRYRVSPQCYLACMKAFQVLVVIICGLVLFEHVVQITIGWRYWPNLDRILPASFNYQGFAYLQPLHWGASIYKPNAVFMLEVSTVSFFIALGIVIELQYFMRYKFLALFAACLLLTFAGTGLVICALTAPFVVYHLRGRRLITPLILICILLCVAVGFGWFEQIGRRALEYQHQGSSSWYRFVLPLQALADLLKEPDTLYRGIGAGNISKGFNLAWWPVVKVATEYGFVAAIGYMTFLCVSMFDRPPSLRIAFAQFIGFNFMGGPFAVPLSVVLLMLFCTFLRTDPPDRTPSLDRTVRPRRRRRLMPQAAQTPPRSSPRTARLASRPEG